jgi:2-keto-myo-inositol isomerase
LRYKDILAEAIHAVGGVGTYYMVHDTFHHALAGFGAIYPELTGIVHVSGVTDSITLDEMRDPHRVLVDGDDILGNVAQIRALRKAGYAGPISYEPFAASVHDLADPKSALAASMTFIREGVAKQAA